MELVAFSTADKAKIRELPVFKTFRDNYINRAKDHDLAAKIYDRYRELLNQK